MWIEWFLVGLVFGTGFGFALGFFVGSIARVAKKYDDDSEDAFQRLGNFKAAASRRGEL